MARAAAPTSSGMGVLAFLEAPAPPRSPVYLVVGKDDFLIDLALQRLRRETLEKGLEEFNHQVVRCSKSMKAGPVVDALAELPMLASVRLLELRDADTLAPAVSWSAAAGLEAAARDAGVVTVLTAGSLPKKEAPLLEAARKLGLTLSVEVAEADRPGWVRSRLKAHGVKAEATAVEELLERIGPDLRMLESHIQRLGIYAGGAPVTRALVQEMVPHSAAVQLWKLTAAVGQAHFKEALELLDRILSVEDNPFGILSYMNTYLLSLARTQHYQGNMRALAEAYPAKKEFQLRKMVQEANTWTARELATAFESLMRADLRLKTGADPRLVLQLLLMQLCSRQKAR